MLILGKYQIIEEAGRGGMGVVYKATDTRLSRVVALKELVVSPTIIGQDKKDIIARFNQEAQTAALLNHPNVITIFDVGEDQGRHFIAMEFLPGKSLKDYLDEGYQYTPQEILDILIQISMGLDHAHSKGVVHRDIKPDNMKMLEGNTVKITDFGIARIESSTSNLTQDGTMLGTLGYISPEQLHNSKGVDSRADIFSFGAMMYEIFTKKLPFDGGTVGATILKIMTDEPVPPRKINPEVPELIEQIILKCLQKDPSNRYQKFKEVIDDLMTCKLILKNPQLAALKNADPKKTTPGIPDENYNTVLRNTSVGAKPPPPQSRPLSPPPPPTADAPKSIQPAPPHSIMRQTLPPTDIQQLKAADSFRDRTFPGRENSVSNFMQSPPKPEPKPFHAPLVNTNTTSLNTSNMGRPLSDFNKPPAGSDTSTPDLRVVFVRMVGRTGTAKGHFSAPRGVAYSQHNSIILVADTQNRRVQAFDSLGTWQFLIQSPEMHSPSDIAVDNNSGKIYVLDSNDCKIRVFDSSGSTVTTFGGKGTGSGQIKSATGIALSNDRIYVADPEGYKIHSFNTNGHYLSFFGKYGEKPGEYKTPYSLAVDSNRIYILDYGLARVQVIDKDGISRAVFGQRGTMKGQFSIPKGIGVDKFGRIYVCDTLNHRIQVFDKTGKWIYSFGNKGNEQGQFMGPEGIAISSEGNIFVLDKGNNRVQVFTYEI